MTAETAKWLSLIADGSEVVNIGQLSADTLRVLRAMTKRGELAQVVSFQFPQPKTAWVRA